jgi:hypothetical protein
MKELKFKLGSAPAVTQLGDKIAKEDLYGEARTLVEKDGRRLEYGYLSPEGQLLRRSQISNVSVDAEGSPVETPAVFFDEQPAEQVASSFDTEAELREMPLTRLVGFNVSDVYALDAGGLQPGLYETTFNYRKSYLPREALILVKPGEAYLLTGQTKRTTLIGKNLTYEFFDAPEQEAAESDPLDFSMM